MTLALRLLRGYAGGPAATAYELFPDPSGGWTWFTDPRAISYGGYTYVGYINGSGDVAVRAVQESTKAASAEVVLHAAFEVDDHDNPSVYLRTDHKLLCMYSKHVGPNVQRRISTSSVDSDPTLSGGFAAESNLTLNEILADRNFTYSNPVFTSNSDGSATDTLWQFYRVHAGGVNAQWHYAVSTDDGATFPGMTYLHALTYSRVVSNGVDRIDVVASNHPSDATHTKIYHLYRESAAWHESDGTSLGATPIAAADMTLVYDSGGDPVWIWDIAYGLDTYPVVTFVVFPSDTDHRYWYGRWTGSAWDTHQIVAGGTYLPTGTFGGNPLEVNYSGGVMLDHANPNIVMASVGLGGDLWEMRRYITADGGATWSYRVVSRSGGKNYRPVAVRNHTGRIQWVWPRGTYTDYVDFSVGTDAYGS